MFTYIYHFVSVGEKVPAKSSVVASSLKGTAKSELFE